MSFDPAIIAAFVDGELDDLTERRIERAAETDTALAAEIARHRALKARLTAHFGPIVAEAVPDRLKALLSADVAIDTSLVDRRDAKRSRFDPVHWAAIAASLVLGLTLGSLPWTPAGPVAVVDGTLVVTGPIADALETQLASSQPREAAVRIGISFRDKDGRYCRSFESDALDGIGCHDDSRWLLERTVRGQARGDYRQASSGDLAAAVAAMMAGDPLDAEAERAARDAGWNR